MFSGIVKEIGTVTSSEPKNGLLEITISSNLSNLKKGDSVSINGCCQTIVEIGKKNSQVFFKAQAVKETLDKTNFGELKVGSKVNLEPSLTMADKLDGHLVLGHVDGTGEIIGISSDEDNQIEEISFSEALKKYITAKGSISVNGVSLTVVEVKNNTFSFTLIPYTRSNTNLGLLNVGDKVNLEADVISRYVVNYLKQECKI